MEIYCVYITKSKKLKYRKIGFDNFLNVGEYNNYGQKLLIKFQNLPFKRKKRRFKHKKSRNTIIYETRYRNDWWDVR